MSREKKYKQEEVSRHTDQGDYGAVREREAVLWPQDQDYGG